MKVLRLAPHIHSSFSDDSDWALTRLVGTLRRAGFHGALVCDHDRTMDQPTWQRIVNECDRIGDESDFLLVPGIEYQDPDHVVHLPVFGRARFYGRSPDIATVISQARADGAASFFAHPSRRDAWRRFDSDWAGDLAGIEVWNRKYDGVAPSAWALRTAREHGLLASVALDWHGPRQLFPLALRVADPGPGNNAQRSERVIEAILQGHARATAFGVNVATFGAGALGGAASVVETARAWGAPRVRALETAIRERQ